MRRFAGDARGNVAIISALAAIPLLVAAGVAIDTARWSRSQDALQVAIDAAALAVASSDKVNMSGLTDAQKTTRKKELEDMARNFVKANYQDAGADTVITVAVTDTTVNVSGAKVYPTTLMNLVGISKVDLAASAEVNLQGGIAENIEIVLVMDTTGSMNDNNKMVDAKAAAKKLIATVLGDAASDDKVRFALVPFSGSVNVGADKLTSGWIDTAGKATVSKLNFTDTTYHNMKGWDSMTYINSQGVTAKLPWNGCVEARLGNYAVDDTPPNTAVPDTLFTPYFAPDEPSTGKDNYYNYSYISKSAEGASNDSDEKRQKNQAKYASKTFTSLTGDSGPWWNCAASPIIPLTKTRATIETAIDAMTPRGGTILPEGFMWGWRVLSPELPYPDAAAFTDKTWRKVLVFMTDGMNDPGAGANTLNGSGYSSYGYLSAKVGNRFGTTSPGSAVSALNDKLLTACDNLKKKAELRDDPRNRANKIPSVEIYTIAFQTTSDAKALLKKCATSDSYFVDAANGQDLKNAFEAIGKRLKTMYLSK